MTKSERGFSLIEMMITIAIFAILLSSILALFKNTNKNLLAQRVISNRDFLARRLQNLISNQESLEATARQLLKIKKISDHEANFSLCVLGTKNSKRKCTASKNERQTFRLFDPVHRDLPSGGSLAAPVFYTSEGRKCLANEDIFMCPFQVITSYKVVCLNDSKECSKAEALTINAEITVRKDSNGNPVPVNPAGHIVLSSKNESATVVLKQVPLPRSPSPIVFSLAKSSAQFKSCLSLSLNGSPFLRVACNHPKDLVKTAKLSLQTLPPPSCNYVQFLVETISANGLNKWTRTTASNIDLGHFLFLGFKTANGFSDISVGYEDEGGNRDFDDLVFTMRLKDDVLFDITNLSEPSFSKAPGSGSIPSLCK